MLGGPHAKLPTTYQLHENFGKQHRARDLRRQRFLAEKRLAVEFLRNWRFSVLLMGSRVQFRDFWI